ncbi:phage shock protein C [Sphingomonas insulae]|uniref:Envelope stress response membrane protein PspC n=1 Tax=Sphingomonas insulae TaxID=424800 RepID=A0ABN1HX21_9SPHN|nr:envelope stress response membrane protein PspC [Sphingomonas insulae]NIJ29924.1 phage shock protein C [Sphingomonas insulae]
MSARTKFYLDPQDGKWKGVCAGIADYTGVDVLWVRLGVAGMTLIAQQWWIVLAYIIVAWVAENKPNGLYDTPEDAKFWQGVRSNPKRSTAEVRSKFRDIDRRLADIELHYTSRNTRLAEEIDSLR